MGEVYRACDPKLGRDVAIKVLPDAFARDAERMARFQREAKVLASFDQPNIASIYGLEDSGGTRALVTDGGTEPQWNRNGRELFYRNGYKMMAVDISTQSGFAAGKPRQLFEGNSTKSCLRVYRTISA